MARDADAADSGSDDRTPSGFDLGEAVMPAQIGHYRLMQKLGEGGMGIVYLAEDEKTQQKVALKTPTRLLGREPRQLKRFFREGEAATRIQHPNVCPVLEVGEAGGKRFIAMKFLPGVPLSKWMAETDDEIPVEKALQIVQSIAKGLEAAHQAGIVHRDLKPGNIMMVDDQTPVIMDFGMARIDDEDGSILTASGELLGTPAYMAPEQVLAQRDKMGPGVDIYALGAIMYELLSGWPPFSGSVATLLGTVVTDPPPRLQLHRATLDPRLNKICQRALEKDPDQRFASAADLSRAIDDYRNAVPETQIEPSGTRPSELPKEQKGGLFSRFLGTSKRTNRGK